MATKAELEQERDDLVAAIEEARAILGDALGLEDLSEDELDDEESESDEAE